MTGGDEVTIMLAAGGTGGHLFPAYALAEELGRRGAAVDLLTDVRGARYGGDFPARRTYPIPSATITSRSPFEMARTAWVLMRGLWAAYRLFGKARPGAVVGFGGYPSFPPLLAARLHGIPSALHEQNAVLGRANRMLAERVSAIALSFARTKFLDPRLGPKVRVTGNPVRRAVIDAAGRPYRAPRPQEPFRLLVFGGSQGARFFADALPPALALLPAEARGRLRLTQQGREEDIGRLRSAYGSSGIAAEVAPFFADLPARMADAHLVVARAGASTVAELTVIGRPALLVPLPHAIDNDQRQNATRLAESGACWCIDQKEASPERLAREIARLMGDPGALEAAAAAAKGQGRPDAVARLADLAEELAGRKSPGREGGSMHSHAGADHQASRALRR